ncbi:MAG: hypothetical protein KME26_10245 [Oscillatoria princeps RMCB-10]|nr:hypothetical protein [Oscillatoria princeps RMCB-10]
MPTGSRCGEVCRLYLQQTLAKLREGPEKKVAAPANRFAPAIKIVFRRSFQLGLGLGGAKRLEGSRRFFSNL